MQKVMGIAPDKLGFQKGFQKGQSGNPAGKKKGTYNEATKRFIEVKHLAAEKSTEAFKMLWSAMEAGESWAYQIYYKELYAIPKNYNEPTVIIDSTDNSVEGQITAITKALPQFDEITHDESLNRLKALTAVQSNESVDNQTSTIRETRESLMEKIDKIQKVIDYAKSEKDK
jgi:hypothetical protein